MYGAFLPVYLATGALHSVYLAVGALPCTLSTYSCWLIASCLYFPVGALHFVYLAAGALHPVLLPAFMHAAYKYMSSIISEISLSVVCTAYALITSSSYPQS